MYAVMENLQDQNLNNAVLRFDFGDLMLLKVSVFDLDVAAVVAGVVERPKFVVGFAVAHVISSRCE